MTKEQTLEAIRTMQAWVDGKAIEARAMDSMQWYPQRKDRIIWDFSSAVYRIKPEPRVVELWVHPEQPQYYRPEEVTPNWEKGTQWTKKKFMEVCDE